jgi:hypothetical protein
MRLLTPARQGRPASGNLAQQPLVRVDRRPHVVGTRELASALPDRLALPGIVGHLEDRLRQRGDVAAREEEQIDDDAASRARVPPDVTVRCRVRSGLSKSPVRNANRWLPRTAGASPLNFAKLAWTPARRSVCRAPLTPSARTSRSTSPGWKPAARRSTG